MFQIFRKLVFMQPVQSLKIVHKILGYNSKYFLGCFMKEQVPDLNKQILFVSLLENV